MSSKDWLLTIYFRNGQIKRILFNKLEDVFSFELSLDYSYVKEIIVENTIYWVN